jgi:hypothetical protein
MKYHVTYINENICSIKRKIYSEISLSALNYKMAAVSTKYSIKERREKILCTAQLLLFKSLFLRAFYFFYVSLRASQHDSYAFMLARMSLTRFF